MKILFMCVANSARGQMAEGLARKILGLHFEVQSGGSKPATLSSYSAQVMNEKGINISNQFAKSINDLPKSFVENLDIVITLCSEEVFPNLKTNAMLLHWPIEEPAQESLSEPELIMKFREVRDFIEQKINDFKHSLYN